MPCERRRYYIDDAGVRRSIYVEADPEEDQFGNTNFILGDEESGQKFPLPSFLLKEFMCCLDQAETWLLRELE